MLEEGVLRERLADFARASQMVDQSIRIDHAEMARPNLSVGQKTPDKAYRASLVSI